MTDVLWETLAFGAKGTVTLVLAVLFVALTALIASSRRRRPSDPAGRLKVRSVRADIDALSATLSGATMSRHQLRDYEKQRRKLQRKRDRTETEWPRTFVLRFEGDMGASSVDQLREEINAIVSDTREGDEVLLLIESPGGTVHGYGLVASQVERLKSRGIKVRACVDKVAASGGYMVACVADEIIAAPFAIIGSIGVAMPLPNAHKLLKRFGIDYEDATAGEYKRTVSPFSEPDQKGRAKLQEQIDETHELFKRWVAEHRPALQIKDVATGEYWLGQRAKELGLVDRLATSDDVILEHLDKREVLSLKYEAEKDLKQRLLHKLMRSAFSRLSSWSTL